MTLILKQVFAFFRLLNSDSGTNQLAAGLSLGLVLGFSPLLSLQAVLIFFLAFFLRIQLGAAFLSAFFFKFVAFALDPLADPLGQWILEAESLRGIFVTLYNMPLVPLTRFNDSIVMGSGFIGFMLALPTFFFFRSLIIKYRATVVERFKSSKFWKAWTATTFYKFYSKYEDLYG